MNHLLRIWQRLTKPADSVDAFVDKQMSQLLSSWLFVFFVIILILYVFRVPSGVATAAEMYVRIALCLLILFAYFLNRFGRYILAGNLVAVGSSFVLWALAVNEGRPRWDYRFSTISRLLSCLPACF